MKLSGKICLKIILKVTEKFHPLFRRNIFRKTTGGGIKLTPPSRFRIKKNSVRKIFIIGKNHDENEDKVKGKNLLRKLWTPITLNCYLLIKQQDKWLVKNIWKSLQTARRGRGRHSSIKTHHSEKLLSVLFWNWKQWTAIMKCINVKWDCNALSVTEIFCCFNKQVENLKII